MLLCRNRHLETKRRVKSTIRPANRSTGDIPRALYTPSILFARERWRGPNSEFFFGLGEESAINPTRDQVNTLDESSAGLRQNYTIYPSAITPQLRVEYWPPQNLIRFVTKWSAETRARSLKSRETNDAPARRNTAPYRNLI